MITYIFIFIVLCLFIHSSAREAMDRGETGQWPACSREFRNTYVISLRRKGFVTFNKHMRFYN